MHQQAKEISSIPLAEWIVATIGLILIALTFSFLAYRAVQEQLPPDFKGEILTIERIQSGYLANARITNTGGMPVADLRLSVDFENGDGASEVVIDYVPSHSSRQVGFLLHNPVEPKSVVFDFISYNEP